MGWTGHVASIGKSRGIYRELVGKSERRRPLGRPGGRREDNINMDVQEVVWGMDWIDLGEHSVR